ncbi:MAG: hypothetical protein Q9195_002893 [Heterodermia aff. obscurata]
MASLQAIVTLTPLSSPDDFTRKLELCSTKSRVIVGRASNNKIKKILADKDNAWFDSPIMSRQHAMLSMSSLPKRIILQDCGSTHGTFVSGERLTPHKPHVLNETDIITFGSRVMSGVHVYPAQQFSVGFEWKTSAFSSSITSSKPPKSTGFRVPEEEEEEDDSSSEVSIADSLEIVNSHPRTYFVPSSEDEESIDEDQDNDAYSTKAAPDLSKEVSDISKLETQSLTTSIDNAATKQQPSKEKTKTVGASQANPIDLEKPQKRQGCIDIESESDDGGPEVLPTGSIPGSNNSLSPKPGCNSSVDNRSSNWSGPLSTPAPKLLNTATVEDWQSDDDYGGDPDFSDLDYDSGPVNRHSQQSDGLKNFPERHVSFKLDQPSAAGVSKDQGVVDQVVHPIIPLGSLDRAPSPSDAALVRKSFVAEGDFDGILAPPLSDENQVVLESVVKRPRQTSENSYTLRCSKVAIDDGVQETEGFKQAHNEKLPLIEDYDSEGDRHKETRHKEDRRKEERRKDEPFRFDDQIRNRNGEQQNTHYRFNEPYPQPRGVNPWEEPLPDLFGDGHVSHPDPKSYRNGPFSIRSGFDGADPVSYNPGPTRFTGNPQPFPSYSGDYMNTFRDTNQLPTYGRDYGYETGTFFNTDLSSSEYPFYPYAHSGAQKRTRYGSSTHSGAVNDLIIPKPLWAHKHVVSKSDEVQPPRVPIANLISPQFGSRAFLENDKAVEPNLLSSPMNPPSPPPEPRGTKRKADQLEASEGDMVQDSFENLSVPKFDSQLSVLPDAQPREPAAPAETIITQTSQDGFVLQGQGSSQSQLNALAAREGSPARKKARTRSSQIGGTAKFISGVMSGLAVGVGIVAAFIATIPDNVREEALREAGNLL